MGDKEDNKTLVCYYFTEITSKECIQELNKKGLNIIFSDRIKENISGGKIAYLDFARTENELLNRLNISVTNPMLLVTKIVEDPSENKRSYEAKMDYFTDRSMLKWNRGEFVDYNYLYDAVKDRLFEFSNKNKNDLKMLKEIAPSILGSCILGQTLSGVVAEPQKLVPVSIEFAKELIKKLKIEEAGE